MQYNLLLEYMLEGIYIYVAKVQFYQYIAHCENSISVLLSNQKKRNPLDSFPFNFNLLIYHNLKQIIRALKKCANYKLNVLGIRKAKFYTSLNLHKINICEELIKCAQNSHASHQDWKSNQVHSCSRGWCLSASWESN